MEDETKYPECEKLSAVKDKSQKIGEFLEWLSEKGVELAARHTHTHTEECLDDQSEEALEDFRDDPEGVRESDLICDCREDELVPYFAGMNKEKLLAEFFGIDLDKVEEERRAMIESLRGG